MVDDKVQSITLAIALAAETRALFSVTLPTMGEIQNSDKSYDPATIRQGEMVGAVLALGSGVVVSSIAKDALPLIMCGIVTVGMIATYEHAIRRPKQPAVPIG